jgi:hypothetical protein
MRLHSESWYRRQFLILRQPMEVRHDRYFGGKLFIFRCIGSTDEKSGVQSNQVLYECCTHGNMWDNNQSTWIAVS